MYILSLVILFAAMDEKVERPLAKYESLSECQYYGRGLLDNLRSQRFAERIASEKNTEVIVMVKCALEEVKAVENKPKADI